MLKITEAPDFGERDGDSDIYRQQPGCRPAAANKDS